MSGGVSPVYSHLKSMGYLDLEIFLGYLYWNIADFCPGNTFLRLDQHIFIDTEGAKYYQNGLAL